VLDAIIPLSSARYEFAAPQCVAEDFSGEIVAINLQDGLYFSLRGLAYAVWQDLIAGVSPRAIIESLADIDAGLADTTASFIADLERRGLIRRSSDLAATNATPTSAALARAGAKPPMVEVFHDMVDLFQADPIHDADEATGWPVRREAAH
jgi:hypothetical protein